MACSLAIWQLLAYMSIAELVLAKGKVIDIFNGGKGDILQLHRATRSISNEKLHNAIFSDSQRKWNLKDSNGNTVIPYIITGAYDATELDTIKEAMKRIERNTCIRFRKRTSEADYIDIQNERGEGCYTSVGRLTGSSVLMLEAGEDSTCVVTEIVQHELLHVIGLWHEHMRYDRDKYIRVNYRNILPGERSQFDIVSRRESTLYNIPYDYKSVMHYGKTAFARPGTVTMETLDPRYTNVIGKQTDASSSDYKKVCNIYDCKVCNSGITREDDGNADSWKPDPNPVPEPEPSVDKECSDKLTNVCRTVKQLGVLDCSYDYAKSFCCATCNAGESGGPDVYYNDH